MSKTVLLASAAVLALSVGSASAKPAHPAVASPAGHYVKQSLNKHPGSVTLYDQTGNDSGVGIVSDNFDSGSFDSYDNQGADDFVVPTGHKWTVKEVDAPGVYFNGFGPADAVNVFFFKDRHGLPGKLVAEIDNAKFADSSGSFTVSLGTSAPKLKNGHYFVSVQANMNFVGGQGEWGWETTTVQTGDPAAFMSAGGFGCTTWGVMTSCIGSYGEGPDFMFALQGKDKAG
jgi:hypothetical protein